MMFPIHDECPGSFHHHVAVHNALEHQWFAASFNFTEAIISEGAGHRAKSRMVQ